MSKVETFYPVYSLRFWRAYLIHLRIYLMFVSGACGLAGMAIVTDFQIDIQVFLMAFIPLFLAYGFGQALTDCFQIDTDSISASYRPLCRKEISPFHVGLISISGLLILVGSLIYLNIYVIVPGTLSIMGLVTYTFFKKRYWFAGPFYNGWIVMLLPLIGYMSVSELFVSTFAEGALPLLMMLSLFSYGNFVLIGYLKDISADKATQYNTFPVVFGWDRTVFAGDIFVLLSSLVCYLLVGSSNPYSFSLFMIATVIAVSGQLFGHLTKNKTEMNAAFPVAATVRSLILWHLAVVIHYQPEWMLFLAGFYLVFELSLFFRPEKEQI